MQLTLARDGDDRDAGAGARSMYDTLQRKATCTSQAAELAAAEERIATDAATAAKREASALKTAAYARELGLDGPRMSYGALSNGHATYVPGCELSAAIGPGGALEAGAAQLAAGPTMERGLHATLGGALMPSASTASLSSARSELEAVWRERALHVTLDLHPTRSSGLAPLRQLRRPRPLVGLHKVPALVRTHLSSSGAHEQPAALQPAAAALAAAPPSLTQGPPPHSPPPDAEDMRPPEPLADLAWIDAVELRAGGQGERERTFDRTALARLRHVLGTRPPSASRSPRSLHQRERMLRECLGEPAAAERLERAAQAQARASLAAAARRARAAERARVKTEMAAAAAEAEAAGVPTLDAAGIAAGARAAADAAVVVAEAATTRVAALEAVRSGGAHGSAENADATAKSLDAARTAARLARRDADALLVVADEAAAIARSADGAADGADAAAEAVAAADAARRAQLAQLLSERTPSAGAGALLRAEALLRAKEYAVAGAAYARACEEHGQVRESAERGLRLTLALLRQEYARPLMEERREVFVRTRRLEPIKVGASGADGRTVADGDDGGGDRGDGGALSADNARYDGYALVTDPRTGQLIAPFDRRPIAAAKDRNLAPTPAVASEPRVPRRRRPSAGKARARLSREFELAYGRLDIGDLVPRAIQGAERAAELREVGAVLRRHFDAIKRVMTTYSMLGAVDTTGGAGGAGEEAFTMDREEFWRLVMDMKVLGKDLPNGVVDVAFVRANWARDPATGKLLDEPGNLSTELLAHELLGALCRLAAAKYARGRDTLAQKVERLLLEHLPLATTFDDDAFLDAFETVPVDQLLDRHAAALRELHAHYAALMPPVARAKAAAAARMRKPARRAPSAEGNGADAGDEGGNILLREWLAFLADVRLLGEHAITMVQAQRIFVLSQVEDTTTEAHAKLVELGGLASLPQHDTAMNVEEFAEAVCRVAFELCTAAMPGAHKPMPLGLGDEDGSWRALVPDDAPQLAFALEQMMGVVLTRWKETDVVGSRTPAGRRMKAALSAAAAARNAAIDVARLRGVDAATEFLIVKAPALIAKARVGSRVATNG
ncbi:hypothetical protein KFE25_005415 [Diacronema lutheri]|uniref:Uncharacterized protein n=1 Tax=Diacronema lutheri TaxID=2081491 RepID=A0A8J6CDG6_DIALT|nr:hypothetical protein KFE25_005415 [Diacronema lutheri]